MQDRFKFRFWSIKDKQFIDWRCYMQTAFNRGCAENPYGLLYSLWTNSKDFIPQQCTGLKDKNGKLIYEGDIIVIPNQYPFYDYKNKKESQNLNDTNGEIKDETILNYVGVVEYIFNAWQYVLNCVNPLKRGISNGINYHLNEQGFEEDENSCYEVIGNIYENKELLTGAEN